MARLILPLAALVAIVPFASAGITFKSPKAGATLTAGTAIQVEWTESGDGPKLTDMTTYTLFLMAGGNKAGEFAPVRPITTAGSFAIASTASGMIDTAAGENSPKNAYFLQITGVGKTGGTYIAYSDRFSYSGMTGVFNDVVKAGVKDISGTTGPAAVDTTVAPGADPAAAGASAVPDASEFDVEYTMQTGLTRYAPMQPVPLTKITAKGNPKPMFPTSSVEIAKTRLPIPKVQTTVTQSQTYSVSSRENTVAAAPHATDDMAKFLNRWKD